MLEVKVVPLAMLNTGRGKINHTGFRRHGRLPKYEDRLWSTIEDSTTFSISICISSCTVYFQVRGTGILAAVL